MHTMTIPFACLCLSHVGKLNDARILTRQLTSELPVVDLALIPPVLQGSMLVPATTPHPTPTMQSLACNNSSPHASQHQSVSQLMHGILQQQRASKYRFSKVKHTWKAAQSLVHVSLACSSAQPADALVHTTKVLLCMCIMAHVRAS